MYNNISGKIKGLATAIFIVETIATVITGIALMTSGYYMRLVGFLIMLIGPLVAWVSSWLIYGFGELIEKAGDIERNTRGGKKSVAQTKVDSGRIKKIEKLRSQGLITEEEYQQALSKEQ